MATQDINANIHIKDESGNINNIYPATKIANVEGLQSALNAKANASDVTSGLAGKVDKVTGKELSTNDYTTAEKNKLAGIEAQANKTVVDSALSSSSTNPVQNKVINTALASKADASTVTALEFHIGKSTMIKSERVFRDIVHHVDGAQDKPCQCLVYAEDKIVVGGHVYQNTQQKICVYNLSGTIVETKDYTDPDLYHLNGIAYNPTDKELYTTGVNNKIVVIDFDTLEIKRKLTISVNAYAISYSDGKLYVLSNNGRDLRRISEVNTINGSLTTVCEFQLDSEERILQLVEQDMTVLDNTVYLCCNQNNIIIAIDLNTGEITQNYVFDEGDGMFPYGELESITDINGQLYFLSVIWNSSNESWVLQIFKSNIGGSVIPCALSGQSSRIRLDIFIDSNSVINNPHGTAQSPFKTLVEASAYASYHSNKDLNTSIHINVVANSHFEADDALSLYGASAEINLNATRSPNTYLRDGVYSIFNAVSDFEVRNSVVKIYASTIRSYTQFYGVLIMGKYTDFIPNQAINLIGVTVIPNKLSDLKRMTLENCDVITNDSAETYSFTPIIKWKDGSTVTLTLNDCYVDVKNGFADIFIRAKVTNWGETTGNFLEISGFDQFPLNFDNFGRNTRSYGNIYINDGMPSKYVMRIQSDKKSFLVTSSTGNVVTPSDFVNGNLAISARIPVSI